MEQIGIKGYTSLLCIMFDNVLNQTFYNLFSAIESAGGYIGILMNIAYTMQYGEQHGAEQVLIGFCFYVFHFYQ